MLAVSFQPSASIGMFRADSGTLVAESFSKET